MSQEAYTRGQWRDAHPERLVTSWPSFCELHPDTEPEAIAEAQREAVRSCLWQHRRAVMRQLSAEEISDIVILPVSVVRRRLQEIESGG